jgi:putative glutamine amidotransferase
MQLMAVQAGGQLEQHLPDAVGHDEHAPGGASFGWTAVDTAADSQIRRLVGDHLQVSCHHHQAVLAHPGFLVSARAADGTIEAIEDPTHDFRLAVQWHPENGDDLGLFAGLVQAASRQLATRC